MCLEGLSLNGVVLHIDYLGEDIYKNRLFILTSFEGIISDEVKVWVDDIVLKVRLKESHSWIPSFSTNFPKKLPMKIERLMVPLKKRKVYILSLIMKMFMKILLVHMKQWKK